MRYRTNKGQLGTPAASWCVRTAAGGVPLPRGDTEAESPGRGPVGRTVSSAALPKRARESIPYTLAVQHREVDVGRGRGAPKGKRHLERSERSAHQDQILRTCESVLRMTDSLGNGPPWLAVRHREVDEGHIRPPERQAVGRGGSNCNCGMRIGDCGLGCNDPHWLAVSSVGRTFSSTTAVPPHWLAVKHREVDAGDRGGGNRRRANLPPRDLLKVSGDTHRTFRRCVGSGRCEGSHAQGGISPPIRYDRAREWISHADGSLPLVWKDPKRTFGRCAGRNRTRNKASTTRSCTSDAEHEFSRTRSPGWHPMHSFRDTRGPQLLLMRPTSVGKGGSDYESDSTGGALWKAFS